MTFRLSAAALVAAGALFLVSPLPASAQTESTTPGAAPAPPSEPQIDLSEGKIDAFIGAAAQVIRIREAWQDKVRAAGTEENAQQMVEAAQKEMVDAVDEAPGITQDEYVAIARASRSNPQLAEIIQQKLSEELGEEGAPTGSQ